ncbi:MFS general substrate transporter [Amniculicola lignicola CBS 123094]|uniref:MFS general substrate transporter n=1 Tax=Amniculicola lignicola CBS 123094 TaxID=1392246 RepID=A0A6A5W158_9PLEO|nr:MFS general substrate transporter [Amniculicola lignicola CBS 123094]
MAELRHSSSSDSPSAPKKGPQDEITPVSQVSTNNVEERLGGQVVNGKNVLAEEDAFEKTAYAWSVKKKWTLLTVVAICQTSMNFNAAIYSNAVEQLNEHFHIKNARHGMVAFLVAYAFGCELWAPWSEELGRWIVMQSSLSFVNISILICALSTSFKMTIAGRVIGGLSSAGGSVTLGMVADMFSPEEQQHAVLWASLWSCLGAVVGGICGGPIQQYLSWRWNFWIQLAFSCTTQTIHFFIAKESRATILLDREAKRQRKVDPNRNIWGPNEVKTRKERWNAKEIFATMWRPYHMLMFEPIVLFLSLLSGFADMLIFSFFESYGYVFGQWNFTPTQMSLALLPLAGSYWLSYFSFFPVVKRHNARRRNGETLSPESRLWWLLFQCVFLPAGLLGGAFVASGPPLHWSGFIVFSCCIGLANYGIYYATVDYMVASYGVYAASATGGNGFARDFLAGICALFIGPMYKALGIRDTMLVLFAVAAAFCIPVYIFYFNGPAIRARSKFAMELAHESEARSAGKSAVVVKEGVGIGGE